MRHEIEVHKGQRYEKVFNILEGSPTRWEVKSVSTRFFHLPHARLVNQEDPRDVRMVCCNTVADGRSFKLVSEPARQPSPRAEAA